MQGSDLRELVELRGFEPLTPSMRTLTARVGTRRCRWSADEIRRSWTVAGVLVAARVAAPVIVCQLGLFDLDNSIVGCRAPWSVRRQGFSV